MGSAVTRRLRADGYHVRAVSRDPATMPDSGAEALLLPPPGATADAWAPLLEGITHIVHCAGIADASTGLGEAEYQAVNAGLTGALASAAGTRIPGKLVLISSIRAICGAASPDVVDGSSEPAPDDAYGRSKLQGERYVRDAFGEHGRFTILRPVTVYGPQMKGSLAMLMRLARLPVPLPVAHIEAKRSLLDVDALAAAVSHAVNSPRTDGGAFVVSDRNAVSIAEIVSAFRRGLGRRAGVFGLPTAVLRAGFAAAGRQDAWRKLAGSLIADPSGLADTGWRPVEDSLQRLEQLAGVVEARRAPPQDVRR